MPQRRFTVTNSAEAHRLSGGQIRSRAKEALGCDRCSGHLSSEQVKGRTLVVTCLIPPELAQDLFFTTPCYTPNHREFEQAMQGKQRSGLVI
jgi:hypothetical protein